MAFSNTPPSSSYREVVSTEVSANTPTSTHTTVPSNNHSVVNNSFSTQYNPFVSHKDNSVSTESIHTETGSKDADVHNSTLSPNTDGAFTLNAKSQQTSKNENSFLRCRVCTDVLHNTLLEWVILLQ